MIILTNLFILLYRLSLIGYSHICGIVYFKHKKIYFSNIHWQMSIKQHLLDLSELGSNVK